jgi:hypothetical protein
MVEQVLQERILQDLRKAAKAERVALEFRDGRVLHGAILFNDIKKCGKLINVEDEISVDFDAAQIRAVKL